MPDQRQYPWWRRRLYRLVVVLGPCGLLMVVCGLLWVQCGIGTLAGHAGTPSAAPHLWFPVWLRATIWIVTGAVAIGCAPSRRYQPVALGWLTLMPMVRSLSYGWSWVMSWDWVNVLIPDRGYLVGSRGAGYGTLTWLAMLLLVGAAALAPVEWADYWEARRRRRWEARGRSHHDD